MKVSSIAINKHLSRGGVQIRENIAEQPIKKLHSFNVDAAVWKTAPPTLSLMTRGAIERTRSGATKAPPACLSLPAGRSGSKLSVLYKKASLRPSTVARGTTERRGGHGTILRNRRERSGAYDYVRHAYRRALLSGGTPQTWGPGPILQLLLSHGEGGRLRGLWGMELGRGVATASHGADVATDGPARHVLILLVQAPDGHHGRARAMARHCWRRSRECSLSTPGGGRIGSIRGRRESILILGQLRMAQEHYFPWRPEW